MAIITPPAELALQIGSWQLGQQRYDITEQSDGNGHPATRLGAPPRWRLRMGSVAALLAADAARWKATVLALRGRINHLAMWDVTNPVPRGTARGTFTTVGSAAAGATSVVIAGAVAPPNLLPMGSFETDANADGLADGWTLFVGGSGDVSRVVSTSRVDYDYNVRHGAWAQYIEITAAGNSNDTGILSQRVAVQPSTVYTLSGHMFCSTASKQYLLARQYKADNTTTTGPDSNTPFASTSVMQRESVTFTTQADAAFVQVIVRGINDVGQSMRIDAVQLEAGAVPTAYAGFATLAAGDWLQFGTGVASHYCMVVADAVANDLARITVNFEPPLRQTISGGTAVAWDKPVAHYKLTTDSQAWQGVPGSSDVGGFALDLLEDWRP